MIRRCRSEAEQVLHVLGASRRVFAGGAATTTGQYTCVCCGDQWWFEAGEQTKPCDCHEGCHLWTEP